MTVKPGEIMGAYWSKWRWENDDFSNDFGFHQTRSGSNYLAGRTHYPKGDQNKRLAFDPEERGLYQKLTIEEQILYFAELHGMKPACRHAMSLVRWMDKLESRWQNQQIRCRTLSKGTPKKFSSSRP